MSLAFRQIKVYFKLVIMVAIAALVAAMVIKNRHNTVSVWFFADYENINVLWLMLCTAGGALVTWWVLRATFNVVGDMREMHRKKLEAERDRTQKKLAEKLAEQEAQERNKAKQSE